MSYCGSLFSELLERVSNKLKYLWLISPQLDSLTERCTIPHLQPNTPQEAQAFTLTLC